MDNTANFIFGIDVTRNDITPTEVRDALIPCFAAAHRMALLEQEKPGNLSPREFDGMSLANAELVIKKFFYELGADYDHPTKKNLEDVILKLAEYSKNFRSDAVIKQNKQEMWRLIDRLS
ncbi:MAG TPA: hypothetical protein VJ579_00685 [Candidatus Paceibacterota bacterium]|nr:hypothetical protein [Candidatus Paceibacterota bacterium]